MHAEQDPVWIYPDLKKSWLDEIVKEFNIHPVTAQILAARGHESLDAIHSFLYAKLPHLNDPDLFNDMKKATTRIHQALKNKEPMLIYGDNDVDGISGTTLLVDFFRRLGAIVYFYIPNRTAISENPITHARDFAIKHNCSLLITVDCGITAGSEIDSFVQSKIDVIITDHHEPTDRIPRCVATLNPKLTNSKYPNRDITGVGVAFKLAHAMINLLVAKGEISSSKIDLKRFLDLVALGTIADMGALQAENRILVRYGLRQFAKTKRTGLTKLLEICEVRGSTLTTIDIASKVAPRINSLGRIADPVKGVELLLTRNTNKAHELATELDLNNTERQRIERRDSADVENLIATHPEILKERALVLASKEWHPGIIPIIAARISKQYNRPTMIISIENGVGKASMRTIPEFPLLPVLRENSKLLLNYGGHDFAAGLTIEEDKIPELKAKFFEAANNVINDDDILPKLHLDSTISFRDLTFDFLESLSLLEPFGMGNPPPLLHADVTQSWPPKIVGKSHLKLYLEQDDRMLEGIGFGLAPLRPRLLKKGLHLKIAFTPHINVFLNKSSIQLQVKDLKII